MNEWVGVVDKWMWADGWCGGCVHVFSCIGVMFG